MIAQVCVSAKNYNSTFSLAEFLVFITFKLYHHIIKNVEC